MSNDKFKGYRIDGVAACRLAWQWFKSMPEHATPNFAGRGIEETLPSKQQFIDRQVEEPLAVRLAGEYDIFDKRDERAELFQHGLRSQELSAGNWDHLLDMEGSESIVPMLLEQGASIRYARDQEYREVITQQGFDLQFHGLTFLACNSHQLDIRSQLFEAGIKPHHDALLGFTFNGKDWRVSLYHVPGKEHLDMSSIAKEYGGGGHRGAAGMRMKTLPFLFK